MVSLGAVLQFRMVKEGHIIDVCPHCSWIGRGLELTAGYEQLMRVLYVGCEEGEKGIGNGQMGLGHVIRDYGRVFGIG